MSSRALPILLSALCAATTQAQEPVNEAPPAKVRHAPLFQRSDLEALDLARRFPRQVRQLTGAQEKFLAFWQPADQATPRGAVIILPSDGENANWPNVIGPLRRALPRYGWSTLALTLPDPPLPDLPTPFRAELPDVRLPEPEPLAKAPEEPAEQPTEAEEPEEPSQPEADPPPEAEPEPEAPLQAETPPPPTYAERIDARIEAALAFARTQHLGDLVLLGHGTGGYWAIRYLSQNEDSEFTQLMVIDPRHANGQDAQLEDLVARLKLPTGDFYSSDPNNQRPAQLRREASQRDSLSTYQQVVLPSVLGNPATLQEQIVRRIRGWLERQSATPPAP